MLIIDRKGFRVMSILHRTYRVTRLRVIYLLNTRQGVWEKITEKVSDETETLRREHRNSFSETEKLFQGIPLSHIGSGTHLEILGGCQNCSGNFWIFLERKTGNVLEQPKMLWLLFADENPWSGNISERVQNYFRGYWKCSGPTEIFSDLTVTEKWFHE